MAVLRRRNLLETYNRRQTQLLDEAGERRYAAGQLHKMALEAKATESFDVFLSHSYDDARIIQEVHRVLVGTGLKVYVDWIEDGQLDRGGVTSGTAEVIRARMSACAMLMYATSDAAKKSVWMPWELGYMDARTGRVCVVPIMDDDRDFTGREYLGIYPYLDLTGPTLFIHRDSARYTTLDSWRAGTKI